MTALLLRSSVVPLISERRLAIQGSAGIRYMCTVGDLKRPVVNETNLVCKGGIISYSRLP